MFSDDRETHRRAFIDAWRKARTGEPLEPLEAQIVDVVREHPEYQAMLEDPDKVLEQDFPVEPGVVNPFLHLGLHIAILEQLSTDRPSGIRKLYQNLVLATDDVHEAEHRIMECLANSIWRMQRYDKPFSASTYLKCIRRSGGGTRPRD
jgi:hypothetical protein